MIKSIKKQQEVYTYYKKVSELVTKLSFKICESIAEKGKSFSDGEFLKKTLKERKNRCAAYSLTLDESTDVKDTAQLVVFVRGVTNNFEMTEEFWDMTSMSSTTTGQGVSDQILKLM
uniref:DUF4371 domain-containing protein n=1 Tax=Octopus bimaculoides TaxID=37653 RepID=A0A0L8GXX6_OCTBM